MLPGSNQTESSISTRAVPRFVPPLAAVELRVLFIVRYSRTTLVVG